MTINNVKYTSGRAESAINKSCVIVQVFLNENKRDDKYAFSDNIDLNNLQLK